MKRRPMQLRSGHKLRLIQSEKLGLFCAIGPLASRGEVEKHGHQATRLAHWAWSHLSAPSPDCAHRHPSLPMHAYCI